MTAFWWETLPKRLGKLSQWFALILTDGYFLLALPKRITDWLSPGIIVVGLLCVFFMPGNTTTPFATPWIFYSFLAIGLFSGHLGLLLLIGFAIGDLLTPEELYQELSISIPLWLLIKLHQYIILGLGMVLIPVVAKLLTLSLVQASPQVTAKRLDKPLGQWVVFGLVSILNVIVASCLMLLWAQIMGLFIGKEYLKPDLDELKKVVGLFQKNWKVFFQIACAATFLRLVGQWLSLIFPSIENQNEAYEESFGEIQAGWFDTLPKWIIAIWHAALLTFLLWHSLSSQTNKILFGILTFLLYMFRAYSGQLLKNTKWFVYIGKMPFVLRLIIALLYIAIIALLSQIVVHKEEYKSFWFLLAPFLIGAFVYSLLLPAPPRKA